MEVTRTKLDPTGNIAVVSVMGLDQSGLAISVDRYVAALQNAGVPANGFIVSSARYREHGSSRAASSIADLSNQLRSEHNGVLWIGLHRDDVAFAEQLESMRSLAVQGISNVVMPERTARPEWEAYGQFLALLDDGLVDGLIHLNARELARWSDRTPVDACVASTPLPDSLFAVGRVRLERVSLGRDNSKEVAVVFVGRFSHRKGFDRLAESWPSWRARLAERDIRATLFVYGQSFDTEADAFEPAGWIQAQADVQWSRQFPSEAQMQAWPPNAVGVALSRQEFDGIAVSELMACGVPILATSTSGHLAIAAESDALRVLDDVQTVGAELVRLALSPRTIPEQGRLATADMWRERSVSSVGARLASFMRRLRDL
jgi:glycosyltransferase involved in cell wall biosynthesis